MTHKLRQLTEKELEYFKAEIDLICSGKHPDIRWNARESDRLVKFADTNSLDSSTRRDMEH